MRERPRGERRPVRAQGLIHLLLVGVMTPGCGRQAASPAPAAHAPAQTAGYLAPPTIKGAMRQAGGVLLSGTASPNAAIRLASPGGATTTGAADGKGAWNLIAPAGPAPRLYSLSELSGGRLVRAVGYVAVLPAPAPAAALLRPAASAAALPPAGAAHGIMAVDYDASGAAMASGQAAGGENVRLYLDGHEAGEDRADGTGAFSASLSRTLNAGPHVLSLAGDRLHASASFGAARTAKLAAPPFDAQRMDGAWRIDWLTPGGGVQSTVLFDRRGGLP